MSKRVDKFNPLWYNKDTVKKGNDIMNIKEIKIIKGELSKEDISTINNFHDFLIEGILNTFEFEYLDKIIIDGCCYDKTRIEEVFDFCKALSESHDISFE